MLKSVKLRNFQKHKKLKIRIKDKILTIVGPTDSGKTAVFRGLAFVLKNQTPAINKGKTTEVEIKTDENCIRRIKGKKNEYWLNGKRFVAFGRNVPDPIKERLNIIPESFQDQFDSPFWINLSPGQLAKELNKLVDLRIIDVTIQNITKKLKVSKIEKGLNKSKLAEITKELENLNWFPQFSKEYKELKEAKDSLSRICDKTVEIERSIKTQEKLQTRIENASYAILERAKLRKIKESVAKKQKTISKLERTVKTILKLKNRIEQSPDIKPLQEIRKRGDIVTNKRGLLEFKIKEIETAFKCCKIMEEELANHKAQLKGMKTKCPNCGKKFI